MRAKKGKRGRGGGKEGNTCSQTPVSFPFLSPSFLFGPSLIFQVGKTQKIPFLGLSLLPNHMETPGSTTPGFKANTHSPVFKFHKVEQQELKSIWDFLARLMVFWMT